MVMVEKAKFVGLSSLNIDKWGSVRAGAVPLVGVPVDRRHMPTAQLHRLPMGRVERRQRGNSLVWLLLIAMLTMLMVLSVGWFSSAGASAEPVPPVTTVVRVLPGDTLWSIATRVASDGQVEAAVQRIKQLNGIGDAAVWPGETLIVP